MMRVLTGAIMPHGDWPNFNTSAGKKFAGNVPATATQPYVGGMPCGFTAATSANTGFTFGGQAGQLVVTAPVAAGAVGINNYVGLLFNNALVDIRRGTGDKTLSGTSITQALPTVVVGMCIVELFAGAFGDVTDAYPPFIYTAGAGVYAAAPVTQTTAWAAGDLITIATHATEPGISGKLIPAGTAKYASTGMSQQTGAIGQVLKPPASITDSMIASIWGFAVQSF